MTIEFFISLVSSPRRLQVISFLFDQKDPTSEQVAQGLNYHRTATQNLLTQMTQSGILVRTRWQGPPGGQQVRSQAYRYALSPTVATWYEATATAVLCLQSEQRGQKHGPKKQVQRPAGVHR